MRTTPSPWQTGEVTAELVLYPTRLAKTPAAVLLHAGVDVALMPLAELADVASGKSAIAESMSGRDTYFVATAAAGESTSMAEETMGGVAPDEVALLAGRDGSLTKLAVLTLSQLAALVAWGEEAEAVERAAR